jgi:hypothetical protein
MGQRMTYRSFLPPLSRGRALALLDPDEDPVTIDIGELERFDHRGSQAGGISQAQDRSVLDVRRRGEQPTNLLRAQNNGQATRLAVEMSSSARSWRFSVTLKRNRRAVALTLAVPTDVPLEASHN